MTRNHSTHRNRRRFGRTLLLAAGLILALTAPGQLAADPTPQARLVPAAAAANEHNQLVLPSGMIFHRTANPVHDLRTVAVPGSPIRLHMWSEELSSGQRQSFYSVSQGATKLRGRVRATTNKVRLRRHTFDPLLDGPPALSPGLAARAGNELYLVQFWSTPLPEFREGITALGGEVKRFLSDHTYIVRMTPGVRVQVAARLPYVRWIGEYHPEYRLDQAVQKALENPRPEPLPVAERYSILLIERSADDQAAVAALVESVGGTVELIEPAGLRLEATLTPEQLQEVVQANEVQFIDLWGGPGELDMDVVRQVGGADYIEGLEGWSGQGVNGEIFDTELLTTHQEWPTAPIIHSTGTTHPSYHGTSCYSINFAQGVDAEARGMLPDGQGIFFRYSESTQFGGTTSRYQINQELIDPAGLYRAVFQTASVGSTRTTEYTTVSAEVDDYLFLHQLLSTQSQSNAGNQMSRPQAWAKNIVAVGGIYHDATADRCDDHWTDFDPYPYPSEASIGPAADGRIKPDLAYFYDQIHAARGTGNNVYYEFGGTSAATPETAGHFGILFQMWHEGVWAGHGGGVDVFDSRPQMATAKALMINNAYRYDWTAPGGCTYSDVDRFKQGWGTADLQRLYDRAPVTSIIDETDLLAPLEANSYSVNVGAGQSELNVTMVYTDLMGTVGAAWARINDLSLRVTSPSATVYWGNNGLAAGNWSNPGGLSNTIDTVENVFIQNPEAGTWTVEVIGDEIVADAHLETPQIDADYALVVSGGLISQGAAGDDVCEIDLVTNTHTCDGISAITFVAAPSGGEAVVKVNLDPNVSGFRRAIFEVEYGGTPSGWTVNVGDSATNNGGGGDRGTQSNDCEMQVNGTTMTVYGKDGIPSQPLTQVAGMVGSGTRLTVDVSNEQLRWHNYSGEADTLSSPYLYALNGQSDTEGPVNYDVYAGFNRVVDIFPYVRTGSGVTRVRIRLFAASVVCEVDLVGNSHTCGGVAPLSFVVPPSGGETVLRATLDPTAGGYDKAIFDVAYGSSPSDWTVNIGDSATNNGGGGDAATQSNDCEMQVAGGTTMTVYGKDGTPSQPLTQVSGIAGLGTLLSLEVSNELLLWDNRAGAADTLESPYLYALAGQPDSEGPVNYDVFAGFNRTVYAAYRDGTGVSYVTVILEQEP